MPETNKHIDPVFLREALDCARIRGLDGREIAMRVTNKPDNMTLQEYGKFWYELAHEMQDEMLNLMTHPMRPGSFSLLCHSILGAPTLEKAIRRALRFLKIIAGSPAGVLSVRNGQAHITFGDEGAPKSAFAYRTLLIVLLGPICWLAQRRIPLSQVSFRCDVPKGIGAYNKLFETQVQFNAPSTKVIFDAGVLALPINRNEAALARFLKQAPGNLLVGYSATDDLTGQVRDRLFRVPAIDWPHFDNFAEEFGMSSSTLRRKLKARGTNYRAIMADVRYSEARKALAHSEISIAALAEKLGYAEPGAFFRAFRSWAGKSPAQFRAEHRENQPCVC